MIKLLATQIKSAIEHALPSLQEKLHIQHWTISISEDLVRDPKSELEIRTIRTRNHAVIYYNTKHLLRYNVSELNTRLIHELIHLVLDRLWEENDFQIHHGNPDRVKEYKERFLRELEKVVEHLTKVLTVANNPISV